MFKKIFDLFKKPQTIQSEYNSEWEKRFDNNPWGIDFVCPHCDYIMQNNDALWHKNKKSPREGLIFYHKCDRCKKSFEVAVSVVVLFKTTHYNYLSTQQKSGFRLIDGGKDA